MTILFLPFAALAKDEATAKICRQIPRTLGAELERATKAHGVVSKFLSSRGTDQDGTPGLVATLELPAPSDLETTARMYGADLVVSGRFGLSDRNLVLEARIFDMRLKKEVFAKHFETYPSYYFDTIEELKVRITQLADIELSERERVELLSRPTESWQALLYYLLAEDDRYAVTLGMGGKEPFVTLDLYREALKIDSEFELARSAMQHTIILLMEQSKLEATKLSEIGSRYREALGEEFVSMLSELL